MSVEHRTSNAEHRTPNQRRHNAADLPSATCGPIPNPHSAFRNGLLRLFRWSRNVFAVIGFVFVVFKLCFELTVIVSESMSPTLQGSSYETGDWVLTEKVTYRLRRPRRWEVIAFRQKDGTRVMKRVAGLPGEYVSMRKHTVVIDGKPVAQPSELRHIE